MPWTWPTTEELTATVAAVEADARKVAFIVYLSAEGYWSIHLTGCDCGVNIDDDDGCVVAATVADAVQQVLAIPEQGPEEPLTGDRSNRIYTASCYDKLIAMPVTFTTYTTAIGTWCIHRTGCSCDHWGETPNADATYDTVRQAVNETLNAEVTDQGYGLEVLDVEPCADPVDSDFQDRGYNGMAPEDDTGTLTIGGA